MGNISHNIMKRNEVILRAGRPAACTTLTASYILHKWDSFNVHKKLLEHVFLVHWNCRQYRRCMWSSIVVQVSAIYHYQRGAELESKKPIKLSLKQIFAFLLELSDWLWFATWRTSSLKYFLYFVGLVPTRQQRAGCCCTAAVGGDNYKHIDH